MSKLSASLSKASNPKLLEIQILVKHGNDERFSFLRKGGKWREFWERRGWEEKELGMKTEPVVEKPAMLVAYDSDDEEQDDQVLVDSVAEIEEVKDIERGESKEDERTTVQSIEQLIDGTEVPKVTVSANEKLKRLKRVKVWAEERKSKASSGTQILSSDPQ
jgi:hypothetical protein